MFTNTQQFVETLRKEDELLEIHDEVDPCLELAEIQRRVCKSHGKAVLFHNVKGTPFKVATNLYGSFKRIDLAFGKRPQEWIQQAVQTFETIFPPNLKKIWQAKNLAWDLLKIGSKSVNSGPILGAQIPHANLQSLPQIKSWPEDGGAFVTLPLVYTEHPHSHKSNLGMYRIQLFNENQCGMHIQIHRGGGFHYFEAEKMGQSLPAHIYIGGPPALVIAAISPLPEDVPEILLASLLMGKKLKTIRNPKLSPLPILADADFCIVGEIPPHERKREGPFGDHYGYYSLDHDYPFMQVKNIYHQKDAIYPATVVGRPPQEDHYIACYLQELLKPLIHMVMPQVKQIWAYEESGVHSLAAAIVKDRYPREALTTALRILGEGQLSLSKVLMVTDQDCDAKDFKTLFTIILERIDFARDLFVLSNISQDTLDYTGPKVNEGSKAIFLGLGDKIRDLPREFSRSLTQNCFKKASVFCPGALAVTGPSYQKGDGIPELLTQDKAIQEWPMVFLLDDATEATKSSEDFIWHVFTRFEPAADVYAKNLFTKRFHTGLTPPVVIDCRMKPWYPKVLESDPSVSKRLEPLFGKHRI
jgi:4-hydroxybenzoate decarboxylase subunit C